MPVMILGVIFVVIGIVIAIWGNPNRNVIIGYRTRRSMATDEAWNYANTQFKKYILTFGFCCLIIGFMEIRFWKITGGLEMLINTLILFGGLGLIVYQIERNLKKM